MFQSHYFKGKIKLPGWDKNNPDAGRFNFWLANNI